MLYSIQSVEHMPDMVSLPEELANSLQLKTNENLTISFGKRNHTVKVKTHASKGKNKIYMSAPVVSALLIDTKMNYEVSFIKQKLIIGPVIGLLLGKREEMLKKHLPQFSVYTLLYKQINGLLFVYCEEQIDFSNEQITGYVYDEKTSDGWRKSILPLPGASFRRTGLSSKTLNHLTDELGCHLFNSHFFDKWHFWNWISPNEDLIKHLPETTNTLNLHSLNDLINKYDAAFLKPRNGSRGKGIYLIKKKKDMYMSLKNYEEDAEYISADEMETFLKKHRFYLLQQPISLQTYENRKVDYRVLLQKNETGYWQCTGVIARFGKADGISSNFKANGFALEGIEGLKLQFGFDELKAFQKYQEIVDICTKMALQIEQKGSYADLGIDIGIDRQGKVWVIEMNKRHDHDFPLMIKNRKMYYSVKANPVLYAKYLAMKSF